MFYASTYPPLAIAPVPQTKITTAITIRGHISAYRYNAVFEQLTLELGVTGSRFEFWSRRPYTIRRFISWYNLDRDTVLGTRIAIDANTSLEIVGWQ